MAEHIDFDMLSLLPDNVKRKIFNGLCSGQSAAGSAAICYTDNFQEPPGGTCSSSTALLALDCKSDDADISSRLVHLPPLQLNGACIVDDVLSPAETSAAAKAVEQWLHDHGRRPGMGSTSRGGLWHDQQQRGDVTSWVNKQELQAAGQTLLTTVLEVLASLRHQLLQQGYDVSGRCSFQLACYPGGGARYVRHADASPANPDRKVTALLYLNTGWDVQADGGQLALYNAAHRSMQGPSAGAGAAAPQQACVGYEAGEPATLVAPLGGRLLVFDSGLEHEVLPAHKHRYSITAWFYKGKPHTSTEATSKCADGTAASAAARSDATVKAVPTTPLNGREPDSLQPSAAQLAPAPNPAVAPNPDTPAIQPTLPRIFVSIASFRDEECQWTLRDLFVRATHPQRVCCGVVWQIDPLADQAFVRMAGGDKTAPYLKQLREIRVHYQTATGPCAARSLAQQLWAGEEYVLQIDAHMRFVDGWDELCLQQLQHAQQASGQARVVLSTYPLGYSGEGPAAAVPEDAPATLLCAKCFDESGLLRICSRSLADRPSGPLPSLFWAAGFSFAPAALLLEVPYCPHLPHMFFGEESYMLARMVTRGWQVWAPSQPVLFHQWERSARANHYQSSVQVDTARRLASQAQVLGVLHGLHLANLPDSGRPRSRPASDATEKAQCQYHMAVSPCEADWTPGGVWGLGTALSLHEFESRHGISFRKRFISLEAQYGGQPSTYFQ